MPDLRNVDLILTFAFSSPTMFGHGFPKTERGAADCRLYRGCYPASGRTDSAIPKGRCDDFGFGAAGEDGAERVGKVRRLLSVVCSATLVAMNFQIGDVVQLKSVGPKMTVTNVGTANNRTMVWCAWFEGTKQETGHFPPDALMKV